MNEVQPITDYSAYNGRMELSMMDKLFFADKIDSGLIVDFGCANGALLKAIKSVRPECRVVGFDIDPTMAAFGTDLLPIKSTWDEIKKLLPTYRSPALILSSVIHEVYHYGSKADIDTFWSQVFDSGFEYIVIRDMAPSRSLDRISNINDVRKVYAKFLHTKLLNDFESIWGSIEGNRQLVHFLLKYRYAEPNWEREVRENYLPLTREDLLAKIPLSYDVLFHEHYTLPYTWQSVKKDTGIEIKDPTHMKLILKRA
jgi:ribosomal protein L11 methylase PrmA